MARKNMSSKQPKQENEMRQRQLRRNQIIFAILSLVLIVSMILSMLINL